MIYYKNNIIKRLFFIINFMLLVSLASCGSAINVTTESDEIDRFIYPVRINDNQSHTNVSNAKIIIEIAEHPLIDDISDTNGYSQLHISKTYIGKSARLKVVANGYKTYSQIVQLEAGLLPDIIMLERESVTPTVAAIDGISEQPLSSDPTITPGILPSPVVIVTPSLPPLEEVITHGSMKRSCFEPIVLLEDPRSYAAEGDVRSNNQLAPFPRVAIDGIYEESVINFAEGISGSENNKKWVLIENKALIHVTYNSAYPELVHLYADCAGAGDIRDFGIIDLESQYSEYTIATSVPDIDYFTLQPGEPELFTFKLRCRDLGSYSIDVEIPYSYGDQKSTLLIHKEVICPNAITFWSMLGGLYQGPTALWNGSEYMVSTPEP